MRLKLLIVLCLVSSFVIAQDSTLLKQNVLTLNNALVAKDTIVLKQLLHPKISFGHSNGWVQSFSDVFADMQNGKLEYKNINVQIISCIGTKDYVVCLSKGEFEGLVNGNAFKLNLSVMQTWIWVKNKWQLIARQSTKL